MTRPLSPHTRRIALTYGLAIAAISFAAGLCAGHAIGSPRLIGIGCDGALGAIYADEESDFPHCVLIGAA